MFFDDLQMDLILYIMLGIFLISIIFSIVVIAKYYKAMRRIPKEVIEISQDGYIYKLADGEVLSVFKIKRKIVKGYVFWYKQRSNIVRYEDLISKIKDNVAKSGTYVFKPQPYWKELKFKKDL